MSAGVVVAGAGQGGAQVAVSLRERGYDAPITLVGDEGDPPYQRPPLSKAYLLGRADRDTLHLREDSFWTEQDVAVITGDSVTDAQLGPAGGGHATTSRGRDLPFEHLVIATGASNRRLLLPGFDDPSVHSLRDLDDADRLSVHLGAARRMIVVGGGFIGLEAAAVARARGLDVTVLEASDRLLSRAAGQEICEYVEAYHRGRGVDIRLGVVVAGLERTADSVRVLLEGDRAVPGDLVVVGIGAEPRIGLAQKIGARVAAGVVVDKHARTSLPGVLAVGDCTSGGHMEFVGRMESVQNAIDQAKVAAATICGDLQPYDAVPFFWSDQGELRLQMAGVSLPDDERVIRRDDTGISVLSFRGGSFRGIAAVNRPRDFIAGRRILTKRQEIDRARADDPELPLRDLLLS